MITVIVINFIFAVAPRRDVDRTLPNNSTARGGVKKVCFRKLCPERCTLVYTYEGKITTIIFRGKKQNKLNPHLYFVYYCTLLPMCSGRAACA